MIEALLLSHTGALEAAEPLGKHVETVRKLRERVVMCPETSIELFVPGVARTLEVPDPLGECVDARCLRPERFETVRHPFECLARLSEPALDLRLVDGTSAAELLERAADRSETLRLRREGVARRSDAVLELLFRH